MKIALVHDYLSQDGGAERVLQSFHEIWPEAPIFVLFHDKKKIDSFVNADIRESFLSKLPFVKNKYQWYLPLMPIATEKHDLSEFDVVLSSTSAFAKGILTKEDGLHISYCHTPTRYLWSDTHEYIQDLKYNFLIKLFLPRLIHKLRIWDKNSVDRVDNFIANSHTVLKRIKKYYRCKSDVIYPPVDLDKFFISKEVGNYFVTGGRIVNYKRFDLVVQAFNRLGFKLKIFGDVPGISGLFFYKQDWETLFDTVINFDKYTWDSVKIREQVIRFDEKKFKERIKDYVEKHYIDFLSEMNRCDL